jgi:hypothetical protein
MADSGYFDLSLVNDNMAVGYERIFTTLGYYYKNNLFDYIVKGGPGGGGYSTVNNLFHFAQALRAAKLITLKTLDQMTSLKSVSHYGYGMKVELSKDGKIIGHAGGFSGISTVLSIYIHNGYTAIVLGNYGRMSARPIEFKMKELIGRLIPNVSKL